MDEGTGDESGSCFVDRLQGSDGARFALGRGIGLGGRARSALNKRLSVADSGEEDGDLRINSLSVRASTHILATLPHKRATTTKARRRNQQACIVSWPVSHGCTAPGKQTNTRDTTSMYELGDSRFCTGIRWHHGDVDHAGRGAGATRTTYANASTKT